MSDPSAAVALTHPTDWSSSRMRAHIRRRYRRETRFRLMGMFAVMLSAAFLAVLIASMVGAGAKGFFRTEIAVAIDVPSDHTMDYADLLARAAEKDFGHDAANWFASQAPRELAERLSDVPKDKTARKIYLPARSDIDIAYKGKGSPAGEAIAAELQRKGALRLAFNGGFLTNSDATDPASAGIWGALKGSLLTITVTFLLAFPVGVLAALYLEEFAPRNRWTDLLEVSINNLAAVPSIIFGLLALAVFLNVFGLPRSSPLVGGITLALMTMPIIVIAGRNAIKTVPPSVRDAALGVGASPVQVVFHHVLPLALPGILTGTIIGLARALGDTAPLLLIGMRAFIGDPPSGFTDSATVLPMQIFLWSDEVDRGFVEKTSAGIIVLLVALLSMNAIAIYLRNRFEKRW